MPRFIAQPTRIASAGNKPKLIDEFVGRVNSATEAVSVAHMRSPGGWVEPGQAPEFDEYTVVLRGMLRVEFKDEDSADSKVTTLEIRPGQAVITYKGEWVRYSTPDPEGAEYIAICHPAFSMDTVHRDPA